ncbi:hypothetical protein BJP24_09835 [Aeromonas allosaccharophila]|nr:hypothetical protein BJP24_09835 [Aeromonas allosaccharophila]
MVCAAAEPRQAGPDTSPAPLDPGSSAGVLFCATRPFLTATTHAEEATMVAQHARILTRQTRHFHLDTPRH